MVRALSLLVLAACGAAGSGPEVDCLYVAETDAEWCACNPDHPFCDGTCDPADTSPFDFVEDGGDCSCADYLAASADPMPTPCILPVFEPYRVWVYGRFAFDGETGQARGHRVDGADVPLQVRLWITDPDYAQTERPEDSCEVALRPLTGTAPTRTCGGTTTIADTTFSHTHLGVDLQPGTFEAVAVEGGTFPSCLERSFDRETYGASVPALLEGIPWSLCVGELHPALGDLVRGGEDDPDDPSDLQSLLEAGFLGGGSFRGAGGDVSIQTAVGYRIDPVSFEVLDDPERARGPWQRVPVAEFADVDELPTALYFVEARQGANPARALLGE